MPRRSSFPPPVIEYRPGKGRVFWAGRQYYLRHMLGTPESRAEYAALVAEWSKPDPVDTPLTVDRLIAKWLAERGGPRYGDSGELANYRQALRPVLRLYGRTPAAEFGPQRLKEVRRQLMAACCRKSCNTHCRRIVSLWRWGAEEELDGLAETWQRLKAMRPLQIGEHRDNDPVGPVEPARAFPVLWALSRPLRYAALIQWHVGARPGEILALTCGQLRQAEDWAGVRAVPLARHKTAKRGKPRTLLFGPRAWACVLRLGLHDDDAAPVIRSWRTGRRYTTSAHSGAIMKACDRLKVARWHPHQLRHAAATELRATFGVEAARTVLGHATLSATEIYAARDLAGAAEAVRKAG